MAKKARAATEWRPLDVFEEGVSIRGQMDERAIWDQLAASLPNWDLLGDDQISAFSVVQTALIFFVKAREDHRGFPRTATVRAHLSRLAQNLDATINSLNSLDLRTSSLLKEVAGANMPTKENHNSNPLQESPLTAEAFHRGHHRLCLTTAALQQARRWVSEAQAQSPPQDTRVGEPGLDHFAEQVAHVWENYAGIRFTASRNSGGAPDFIHRLLKTAGFSVSRAKALKAAQDVVTKLEKDHPGRIVVAHEDRHRSLAELASLPRKRKSRRRE